MEQRVGHAKILQLHHFNLDASWSTECRLTQPEIFTSFLLGVATLRRCCAVTLITIYINEGKTKTEQYFLGPKSMNTIINSERKCLSCRVEGGDANWRFHRLPVVTGGAEPQDLGEIAPACKKIRRYTPVHQCPSDGAGCLRGQRWLQTVVLLKLCGVC